MVRQRDVHHVHVGGLEQHPVIRCDEFHAGYLPEPVALWLGHVADRHQLRPRRIVVEDKPAAQGAGDFAAHQTAANDADPDALGHTLCWLRKAPACSAVAPSWTMASSARVMPGGFGC